MSQQEILKLFFGPAKSSLQFSARKSFHSSGKSTAIIFNYFWPDLASAHYADATQQFLKDEGIWYIPKYNNPSAIASLRPIEDFWAAVKKIITAYGR